MNTCMNRLLLCACMALSLSFFTGCGPKPVEPYQQKTGAAKPDGANTFYDYASGAAATDYGAAPESAAPVDGGGSMGMDSGGDYSVFDNLPVAPGTGFDGNAAFDSSRPEPFTSSGSAPFSSSEAEQFSSRPPVPGQLFGSDPPQQEQAAPIVEPLDAGSKPSEKISLFANDNKPVAYKKKNGRSSVQLKSIYYDFDQSSVRKNQTATMEGNAQYLKKHPNSRVIVEGNCDERGTNEYNLALGQRRAINAKKYLVNLGINPARIKTVSFGEERPLFRGSEESDYALNRRSDFVLARP